MRHFLPLFLFAALLTPVQAEEGAKRDNQLTQAERDEGWKLLFNGVDLTGFGDPTRDGKWRVIAGVLTGTNGKGVLPTKGRYNHFTLSLDARIYDTGKRRGNSGIFIRSSGLLALRGRWPDGPEIQIDHGDGGFWTGSIWQKAKAKKVATKDREWFNMRIEAIGRVIRVWINGELVTRYDQPEKEIRRGPIAFQVHHKTDVVEFKNIKIRPMLNNAEKKPKHSGVWSRFRGQNGSGLAVGNDPLPDKIGPETNVEWKVPLASGHSSPVIHDDRVYVTAMEDRRLLTLALDARDGSVLWKAEAPYDTLEPIHRSGSYAQPSPATDGKHVVCLFGSTGLFCYNTNGKPLWDIPMGPFNDDFGAAASPFIVGDRVILNQDHDLDSFLMSIDLHTGEQIWKTNRPEFPRSYSTPIIWQNDGQQQIVVCGTLRIVGYDFETGKEVWSVGNVSRLNNMTPVVGRDNMLYVAAWAPGGDAGERIETYPFGEFAKKYDKNQNGSFEAGELPPKGPIGRRFRQLDRDKDGHITRTEYESMRQIFDSARNLVFALRPGGEGDITESHVVWQFSRLLPYVPSPLYYGDHLYMVKNGGIFSCLDAKTGDLLKHGRVSARGNYFSSPVAGDGKIYLVSERGEITVVRAGEDWQELSAASLGEDSYSTPAVVAGRIYLRTSGHLYCFSKAEPF